MKTKQIKGAVDILLVGEAPEGVNYLIHNKESTRTALIVYTDVINSYPVVLPANLPLGEDWQFHCRLSEMTEEQAANFDVLLRKPGALYYTDFTKPTNRLHKAKESFKSLLEANGVLNENPYGFCEGREGRPRYFPDGAYFNSPIELYNEQRRWDKAEANVFPPETTLVFIKE